MYLFFAGFRGSYRPPAPPNHGLKGNRPDVHDEADFDIPNTHAMLERFMSNMSKLADVEYQVQGPGELRCKDRVSDCCQIISIYLLYALYIYLVGVPDARRIVFFFFSRRIETEILSCSNSSSV